MIAALSFPARPARLLLPVLILASCFFFLKGYFFPQFQVLLGLLIAPFIFTIKEPGVLSGRYFYATLFFLVAYYFVGMKLLLYFGLGCFLFYSIESRFGKIGLLPLIFLGCISPALHYVVNMFTFSLRLALSHYAAELLNSAGLPVQCHGNYFTLADGFAFNVDKACLGLNLFNTGFAFTALIIGLAEKRGARTLPLVPLCSAFALTSGLLVITNFLRIVMIVFFRSLPGTVSHEVIGMAALIVYTALPMHFLVNRLLKRFGRLNAQGPQQAGPAAPGFILPAIGFAMLFVSFTSVERASKTTIRDTKLEQLVLNGFSRERKQDGVMEYRRRGLLVYIKPAVRGFESDHPPVLCWKGSGFDVEQVAETTVGSATMFTATLKKGAATYYTAWWYDNGQQRTTSQWAWRLNSGEPFRIVNLTCSSKTGLADACREFLQKRLF